MIIELQWAWTPDELERAAARGRFCGVCGFPATPTNGGVMIDAATDEGVEMGGACEECIAYLGARNPSKSPSLDEYRRIVAEHPRPMFSSDEEMNAAAPPDEDPADTFYDASWLWTVAVQGASRAR